MDVDSGICTRLLLALLQQVRVVHWVLNRQKPAAGWLPLLRLWHFISFRDHFKIIEDGLLSFDEGASHFFWFQIISNPGAKSERRAMLRANL
jgi:hypothetical protein